MNRTDQILSLASGRERDGMRWEDALASAQRTLDLQQRVAQDWRRVVSGVAPEEDAWESI